MWNPWSGQDPNGKDDPRLVHISPFFFSQHGLRNIFYIPKLRDLPASGLDLKVLVFDFGFDIPANSLGPKATAKRTLAIERPILIWGCTGVTSDLSNPAVGFNFQILHNHGGSQRQFFNKHVNNGEIAGDGHRPMIFRMPYMVIKGDEVTCEVKNLSNNAANPGSTNSNVQVCLFGGEFD